jgi:hypothetical protein
MNGRAAVGIDVSVTADQRPGTYLPPRNRSASMSTAARVASMPSRGHPPR